MIRRAAMFALAALWVGTLSAAGSCGTGQFTIHGLVSGPGGQPVPRARVYLLLDKVSDKKYESAGFRAVPFQADEAGRFVARIDCEAYRSGDRRDQPNPCARKPRDVTVLVGRSGFGLTARVYKLKELMVIEGPDGCSVALPEVRLPTDR